MTNPVDSYPPYPSQDDEDDDPDGLETGSNRGNNATIHKRGYQACEDVDNARQNVNHPEEWTTRYPVLVLDVLVSDSNATMRPPARRER